MLAREIFIPTVIWIILNIIFQITLEITNKIDEILDEIDRYFLTCRPGIKKNKKKLD
jgi:hypothetical protein